MRMFRKDEGFTLVELMVVVLIIGILVAIAVPVFLNASANAALKACQGTQRTIEGAVQTYDSTDAGIATPYATGFALVDGNNVLVKPGISQAIKSVPKCPSAAAAHFYSTTAGLVDGDNAVAAATAGVWTAATPNHVHF